MSADFRRGLWMAVASFVLWGLMPLFWHALKAVPSLQIVAHRIVWSALLVGVWLAFARGGGWLRETLGSRRLAGLLAASALLIGFNWGLYIWAVNAGHVVETSLGYYINPLLNVLLGVVFFHERLRPAQWLSVALASAGVAWMTWQVGHLPWIALSLALSFGLYGVVRKVAQVDSVVGLGVESSYLFLPALALMLWGEAHGSGGFIAHGDVAGWGWLIGVMLVVGGALTALPLVGFAYAVRRIPLSLVGFLQYIAPTLQLLTGVLIFGEAFDAAHAAGFGLIWAGLIVFAGEGLWRARVAAPPAAASSAA